MLESFFGELHPSDFKRATSRKTSSKIASPPIVTIPMSMHFGENCVPLVSVGDIVKMGQKIGDSKAPVSAPVHASVSGKVIGIEPKTLPSGKMVMSVIIENDGLDTLCEEIAPQKAENISDPDVLCGIIREAGIVGMGGGAYPTAAKIRESVGKVNALIINGAESEPALTSDYRVMVEHPYEFLDGIRMLKRAFGLPFAYLGIERNKHYAISFLGSRCGSDIRISPLKSVFPRGEETQIIKHVLKREAADGSALKARAVVFNVSTVYAIYRAVNEGMPLIDRIVTVSGGAVEKPSNFICRIGTPISHVFEAAGGFSEDPFKILVGGPMTGTAQYDLSVPVTKSTRALLAITDRMERHSKNSICIRCGRCVEVCPMRLMPLYIYTYETRNDTELLNKYHVSDCIECGMCTYICPGRIDLMQSCKLGKLKLGAAGKDKEREEGALRNGQRA